jgi:hypothetical protein
MTVRAGVRAKQPVADTSLTIRPVIAAKDLGWGPPSDSIIRRANKY